ncbi:hypothetical protein V6N13_008146 [Hibiscus sabdariffa]|uniref:Uncharacterized protein n=1 Tax=Hibiscus sabdariffa TaxID=183260 RepID=A0ABR2ECS0_9ROSI
MGFAPTLTREVAWPISPYPGKEFPGFLLSSLFRFLRLNPRFAFLPVKRRTSLQNLKLSIRSRTMTHQEVQEFVKRICSRFAAYQGTQFLKQERKEYVIEEPVPDEPASNAPRADKDKFKKHMDNMVDVGCLMLATMDSELQKQHENMVAYEMIQNLKEIYEGQARQERYETSKALFQCKMTKGTPVGAHAIKMMGYVW